MILRSLILRSEEIRETAAKAVLNLPIDAEHPKEVVFMEHKAKRSTEANSRYWAMLGEVSQQAWIQGRQYPVEVIHEYAKRYMLPDECAKGVPKWITLPNGDRALGMSTTDLNTAEFSEYMTQVEAWAAGIGVLFSADRAQG